jgi:hypothetical protein
MKMKYEEQFSEFQTVLHNMMAIHVNKAEDYGSYAVESMGLLGVAVRIWDKAVRILTLLGYDFTRKVFNQPQAPKNESLEDSFIDLACYCIIAVVYLRGKWGK